MVESTSKAPDSKIPNTTSKAIEEQELVKEILPKAGLVYSEKATLSEVLCKPKILPLKSATLMKLEKMESDLA
jgi:BBSome-interacting protein 1